MKIDEVAKAINNECKFVIPGATIMSVVIILSSAGPKGWMGVGTASNVVNFVFVGIMGGDVAFTAMRILSAMQKKVEVAPAPKRLRDSVVQLRG